VADGITIRDTLSSGLALAAVSFRHHLEEEVVDVAAEALEYAKHNAPWADRTGDARAGLDTSVQWEGEEIAWYMYHEVDYGIWLETILNGKFAIIMPTLELFANRVGRGLREKTEVDYG
jgi:hypothetical protein